MQFHLNGFKPGDPSHRSQSEASSVRRDGDGVDVLIVGCGPAGLVLAAQLAAFPDISTRIVEQKAGPLQLGQADGISCRSMEMFEAFGFSERILKEAYWVNEVTFWKPDPQDRGRIVRSGRVQDTEDGLSEFPHVILNQARVHDFLLDAMRHSPAGLEPDYGLRLLEVTVDRGAADYPVTATLQGTDGVMQAVRARYLVGCDGARSTVRASMGKALRGDSANQAWGVMDVLAVTDFPDVRFKTAIHSGREGSVLIIPREGGYLFRIYIELDKLNEDERIASKNITQDHLVAAAQRVLRPYTLEVKEVAWWSVYEIGQRLCDSFDDADQAADGSPRVFIAGDACHTHSPKAGQGMNVSMGDGFNLGWKLASVLRGQARPQLLGAYSAERQAIAKELIDFDREFARMFSAPPKDPDDPDSPGVDPAEFQRYFVKQGRFTAGTVVRYGPSIITGDGAHQHLAKGFLVGTRFHSAPVVRLADGRPIELGHVLKADGRWRVLAFCDAGDPGAPQSRLAALCAFLDDSPASPLRITPEGADIDCVIDVRAVLQQDFRALSIEAMPRLLTPPKGRFGLREYEKVFCAGGRGPDIFDLRQVDRGGCVVVVRPDQHVAAVLPLDAQEALGAFFAGWRRSGSGRGQFIA
jgi:2-polyprenyl-6-methoxyphenol hydroxylase-like FAD-dependent oxidoreductase